MIQYFYHLQQNYLLSQYFSLQLTGQFINPNTKTKISQMSLRDHTMTQRSEHSHVQQLLTNLSKSHKRHMSLGRANHSTIHSERSFTLNTSNQKPLQKNSLLTLLKNQIQPKIPWKSSSIKQQQDPLKRLNHKHEMDNWQISRIQLSKRSYQYPKSYKGIKIPEKGRQFDPLTQRDKDGHLPYLYQNEINKYDSLKQKLSIIPFKVTNSVRHDYFGFGKQNYLNKNLPNNQSQLIRNKRTSYELSIL